MSILNRTWMAGAAAVIGCSFASAQAPAGIHPRATAADYATSQTSKIGTFAVSVIPADQVKHIFAVDISKTYVVFEVALYPSQSAAANLDPTSFLIKIAKNSEFVRPVDAVTIASVMQDKNTPRPPSVRSPQVYTEAGVGYESGTDPYTGRREHGTYTEAGAGVGTGPVDPYSYPSYPPPGASPRDRMILERQLTDKALPAGNFAAPVAGFLYFQTNSLKKSNGKYELEYLGGAFGDTRLEVPAKTR